MNKVISFILLLLLSIGTANAQVDNSESSYDKAEKSYRDGYFSYAEKTLLDNMHSYKGKYKENAYRLLVLCELEAGSLDKAKEYVYKLLATNPYYTARLEDPQRFIDFVDEAKQQESGITTASRQAESLDEAPVPVTVITNDMIRHSGASTLQEVLCLFVPGMSIAEGMEANIAMHGIAGLTQESILFLQDGHRLNGGSSNAEAPDYRNSLDKIQQIEVLRGPASSLYGNVALTAVVNIITYKGAALNGGHISGTVGTQNTYGGSFIIGGGNNVVDITGWGSINTTAGFKHTLENTINPKAGSTTTLYAHGFNQRPAYDIGIKARWGDFTMTINSQRAKQVPYFNIFQLAADQTATNDIVANGYQITDYSPKEADYNFVQNYNYDKYADVNSNKPGTTRTNHHINLDFVHSLGNVDFQVSGYVSLENTDLYNALGDSVDSNLLIYIMHSLNITSASDPIMELLIPTMYSYMNHGGVFFDVNWENITFGGQAQALCKYNFLGHGTAIFGLQYEHFALTEGLFKMGFNYSPDLMITKGNIFEDGMEDNISVYTQIKHYFSDKLILNAGLRYDHKIQFNSTRLNNFSPRLSLIYKIKDNLSARASYNFSFVDAPYLYRALKMKLLGGNNLQPETMKSLQVGLTYHNPKAHLTAELSGYYNMIADLITQAVTSTDSSTFHSSGRMRQLIAEAALQYNTKNLMVNANTTWQRVTKAKQGCNVVNGNRLGIPELMGNVSVAWSPYVGKGSGFFDGGKLWVNTNLSIQSKTYYQNLDFMLAKIAAMMNMNTNLANTSTTTLEANDEPTTYTYREICTVDPQVVMGIGMTYEWKHLDFSLTLKNITNNEYYVGSNMSSAVPHAGRQLIGKLTLKF